MVTEQGKPSSLVERLFQPAHAQRSVDNAGERKVLQLAVLYSRGAHLGSRDARASAW
jgi:hypothetical protein